MVLKGGRIITDDARGEPSVTLPLVYLAFLGVMFRFVIAGHFGYADMTGTEFGVALGAVGGIWLWREGQARRP